MAWTEQDYQEIVARLMAESIGVNEVPDAGSTDDISSLPAYQPANGTEVPTVVKASLELLVAPALEAADKANEAADKAESNATAAQTAANTANEKAELAAQAASDATAAKEEAETATQSANNAASNAEEKAEAANTAAQDAEKVANNPTYIGTDHYVYVYNKETDSFDKTGIYCKGEPGSSFRVAGEYATLEALKSAVPDGSTIDGFMAVGTEAPYDYYAWVNGDWVNQGKIAGGGSGNVVIVPIMGLTTQSTSDEIFNAFGGKQNLIDIIKKVKDEDCVVIAKTDDDPNAVVQQTFSVVNATYVNDNNLILGLISWSVNVTSQMIIQVIDGVASYNEISTPLMTEAPSDGNVYGRKNKDWVKVPENSNVISLPSALLKLTGQSNSSEILSVFGGLDALRTTIAKLRSDNYIIMCGDKNGNYSYVFDDYHVNYTDENNFKLSLFDISGSASVNANFLYMIVSLVDGVAEISSKREYSLVKDTDVLTKTNTSSFTPTRPYHPATKQYVDDSGDIILNMDDYQAGGSFNSEERLKFDKWFSQNNHPVCFTGTQSEGAIFTNATVHEDAGVKYVHIAPIRITGTNLMIYDILEFHVENGINSYTYNKYMDINKCIVLSDNLTTITKKTAAEYEALGSKDANTAYCVTD